MNITTINFVGMPSVRFNLRFLLLNMTIAVVYLLLSKSGMLFADHHGMVTLWWPSGGFALAVLLLGGWCNVPGIFLGTLLTSSSFGDPLFLSIPIALTNTLEVVCGWWLLTRWSNFDVTLDHLQDFLLLAFVAAPLIAFIGAAVCPTLLMMAGMIDAKLWEHTALHWWMADLLGIFLVTPLMLAWQQIPKDWLKSIRLIEVILILGLTFLSGQVIFLGWFHDIVGQYSNGFMMFLLLSVVAIRLGLQGVSIALMMTAIQALMGASQSIGYFGDDLARTQLTNFWLYLLILTVVATSLATYVSEKNRVVKALRESERCFRTLANNTSALVWMSGPDALCTYFNTVWLDFTGRKLEQEIGSGWTEAVHPDEYLLCKSTYMNAFEARQEFSMEFRLRRYDGEYRWLIDHGVPRHDDDGVFLGYIGSCIDITQKKAATDEIERLAFFDPLTGLPNRRLLQDRLKLALASSNRSGRKGALLFIDMDNFKTLNDTLGHDMGDLLLQQVAQRLEACLREGDTVARLGGDEFVVMLEDLSEQAIEAAAQTETIGNKILTILNQPYLLSTHNHHSTPSIGAILYNDHEQSVDELLKQADIAMYQAKASGRNALCFFDPQMQARITARVALEADLRLALVENQFKLFYQPQVYHNRRVIGAEVLIRWLHPVRNLVSPADFIPLAEETGLILPIGQWVLETACAQLKIWEHSVHTQHLQLAVNVSARQFHQEDFVQQVRQILSRSAINPDRLKLELTESLVHDDINDTILKMHTLREIGVHFSMDDFGTGYSSLSSLKKLPLDQLKIDQSFVRDLSSDPDDAVIVQTIIAMANNLGMEVIAEGVETEAQRSFLEQHGCPVYQGYLFSKPVPIEQFELLLNQ